MNFKDILKRIRPDFIPLEVTKMFPRPIFFLLYVPSHPLLTKMFQGLNYSKELKTFANSLSSIPMIESWKTLKIYLYTYLDYDIIGFNVAGNLTSDNMNIGDLTGVKNRIKNISFSSQVIGRYGSELAISKDMKSVYMTMIYILKCSIFSMYPGEKMPEVKITGLPNSIFYPIYWPSIQLLFYYLILGCIILHLKTIRRLSDKSIIPQKGWYTIANYFTITILYQILCSIVFISTSITLCTDILKTKMIHYFPWYLLMLTFMLNITTLMMFGMSLCELDMSTYNLLYFLGMIMAPQLLYMFTFGQNFGVNCYFQYLTCLSPLFAVSWSLTVLENIQADYRFFESVSGLLDDFSNKCFSFYTSLALQVIHIIIYIIFICYMNFIRDRLRDFRQRHMKSLKKIHKKPLQTTRISTKQVQRGKSSDSLPLYPETEKTRHVIFAKSEYIVTVHKAVKTFTIRGRRRKILKRVSAKFRRNKITTILGPNGSGKSTMLGIISGVLKLNSGNIIIDGKSVLTHRKEAYNSISKYVDEMRIFNFLLVSEYFELIIQKNKTNNYALLHYRLVNFVEICQLQKYLNVRLEYCPVSILRMVKIVCVFLSDKPIVLLDDPMEGLDYIFTQNICALFAHQKLFKTIIYTSCNSDIIEYVTDSVIVLINGRKISQTDIENFNLDQMLYKLVCSMEPDTSDYTLTRYMKLTFPMIKYDETADGVAYFNIPQMTMNELWNLLQKLDYYGSKLGIWRYKFLAIGMRHFLTNAYDYYLKLKKKKRTLFNRLDILPEQVKQTSIIYKRYFFLLIFQRILSYCRYPNRLLMRFFIPVIILIIWTSTTSLSHPTIFLMDNGYSGPTYKEELNDKHQIFIGCEGENLVCDKLFADAKKNLKFINNIFTVHYRPMKGRLLDFENYLFEIGERNYLQYNNLTLFGVFFTTSKTKPIEAVVLANDYKNRIVAYSFADNILMFPKHITISRLDRIDLLVQRDIVEINFIFRLIMIILFAYSMTTYRYVAQSVQQQFYAIHRLAGVHFSLIYIPAYLMDVFLYLMIMCFMILFIYIMEDHELTIITINITDVMSLYFLFVLADSSFKLLIEYLSNYNPVFIFVLKCIDIFILFYLNMVYLVTYTINIQQLSYGGVKTDVEFLRSVDIILKLFFPVANLNDGLRRGSSEVSNLNGVLFIQWIMYFSCLFFWHYQKYRVKAFIHKCWCFTIKSKRVKLKNIGNENSFLYVKNVSYVAHKRMFFENLNIEFQQGTVWGILGRNNSGKTHFLNILLGRTTPTTGGVYLYNHLIKTLKATTINVKIGYCSENRFFIPDLTVEETMLYWSRLLLIPECSLANFVKEILEVLLLSRETETRVRNLSNNNIKKLDIALAIIGYPKIVILDDPLAGLDSLARQGVINLIERAKSNNCTIIMTCTEISELRNTLTHLAILVERKFDYIGPYIDAISESKLGYYLTIFLSDEFLPIYVHNKLTKLIQSSFKDAILFKNYQFHLIFFIPFQNVADPNTTKILLFMETIRLKYRFVRFIIKYDVFFDNPV